MLFYHVIHPKQPFHNSPEPPHHSSLDAALAVPNLELPFDSPFPLFQLICRMRLAHPSVARQVLLFYQIWCNIIIFDPLITPSLIQIAMNFSFDFWEASPSEHSVGSIVLFYEPESSQQHYPHPQAEEIEGIFSPAIGSCLKSSNLQHSTQPERMEGGFQGLQMRGNGRKGANNRTDSKTRQKRKMKPSPYHNYQKHLNTTLRYLIVFPQPDHNAPPALRLAHRLWSIFVKSESATKKILHFIFNQFNEHRLKREYIEKYGFGLVYSTHQSSELGGAKRLLTEMAVEQMSEENIDNYLETRRIKNQAKFKRYLMIFRKELQDGFLKKRFTNRNRKEKIKKELLRSSQ